MLELEDIAEDPSGADLATASIKYNPPRLFHLMKAKNSGGVTFGHMGSQPAADARRTLSLCLGC